MESLRSLCDHAILIEDGVVELDGDPADVANRYLEINLTGRGLAPAASADGAGGAAAGRIAEFWLENSEGERLGGFKHRESIHLVAVIEAKQEIDRPRFGFQLSSANGVSLFAAPHQQLADSLAPGDRVTFRATVANPLAPGTYVVNCRLSGGGAKVPIDWRRPAAKFVVWGRPRFGTIELDWTWEVERQPRTSAMEAARE